MGHRGALRRNQGHGNQDYPRNRNAPQTRRKPGSKTLSSRVRIRRPAQWGRGLEMGLDPW